MRTMRTQNPKRVYVSSLVLLLLIAPALGADKRLAAKLTHRLETLERFGFSGTVLVAKGKEILLDRGFGMARRQEKIPVQAQTPFPIASMSKQFTAAAILKLEEEGHLEVADSIGRHFLALKPSLAQITIHQLLTHTSGLPFECEGDPAASTSQDFLRCLSRTSPEKGAGRFSYSNAGYALLASLIEQVSGLDFASYLRSHLFQAAQMTQTSFIDDLERLHERSAHQYTWWVDHGSGLEEDLDYNLRGSADMVSTATDLWRWEKALRRGGILGEASRQKLVKGYLTDPESGHQVGYGVLLEPRSGAVISGGTFTLGFNCSFRRYPAQDLVTIVLSNQNYGLLQSTPAVNRLLDEILLKKDRSPLPRIGSASLDPKRLAGLPGRYRLPDGSMLQVEVQDDAFVMTPEGQSAINLLTSRTAEEGRLLLEDTLRTQELFDALLTEAGEVSGKAAEMKPYKDWIGSLESKLGRFKSCRVIGTIPQGESSRTYVELNFEQGSEVRRLRWLRGRLQSILEGGLPVVPTRFLARSRKDLVGFHLAFERSVPVRIQLKGQVVGALHFGPKGRRVAKRNP